MDHLWPEGLPGGRAVVFSIEGGAAAASADDENRQLAALDIASGRITSLVRGGSRPRFVAGGYLAYTARGKAFAVPFDAGSLSVPSGATPVDLGIQARSFAVSASGSLVYSIRNTAGEDQKRSLVWIDRSGRETPIAAPARLYQYPEISPDGTRVAVSALGEMNDSWIWHFGAATLTRFTLEPSVDTVPLWTPDGKRVVFASDRVGGVFNLWWQPADGSGSAEQLTAGSAAAFPTSISPDGKQAVYWSSTPTGGRDLLMVALDGSRQVTPLLRTPADDWQGVVSPDGRWLAYESNSSGQPNVHVRPFPKMDAGQWQVTTGGGRQPLWSRDGKELFFFSTDGALMHVSVSSEIGRFTVGTPAQLFGTHYYGSEPASLVGRTYDVSPDGQRLLMIKSEPPRNPSGASAGGDVVLVQNWVDDLARLMQRR
jgi:serine/threonine-protein kinase